MKAPTMRELLDRRLRAEWKRGEAIATQAAIALAAEYGEHGTSAIPDLRVFSVQNLGPIGCTIEDGRLSYYRGGVRAFKLPPPHWDPCNCPEVKP